jgi:hypothetical protein
MHKQGRPLGNCNTSNRELVIVIYSEDELSFSQSFEHNNVHQRRRISIISVNENKHIPSVSYCTSLHKPNIHTAAELCVLES